MSNPFYGGATAESTAKAVQQREKDAQKSVWLDAWFEPLLHLDAHERTVVTTDLFGDNDYKLLITTYDDRPRIKVFKNTSVVCELQLPDRPTSVVAFYQDKRTLKDTKTNAPILAVACADSVYFYRHLKPVSKLTVPAAGVPPQDYALWEQLQGCTNITPELTTSLYTMLSDARDDGFELSSRSKLFLDITSKRVGEMEGIDAAELPTRVAQVRTAFIQQALTLPHTEPTAITILSSLPLTADPRNGALLLIGTEHGELHFTSPLFNEVMFSVHLPATPFNIQTKGSVDEDAMVFVACRDGNIYCVSYPGQIPTPSVSRMQESDYDPCMHPLTLGLAISVGHTMVDFLLLDSQVVVATMHRDLIYYNHAYQPRQTMRLPAPITHLRLLSVDKVVSAKCVLVAMENGDICMYNGAALIDTVRVHAPLLALCLGHYGKEDSAMLAICRDGSLYIKILQRKLDSERFRLGLNGGGRSIPPSLLPARARKGPHANAMTTAAVVTALATDGTLMPSWQQEIPLQLPEKSHLFVQQAHYERAHAEELHMLYQRDLCQLRLLTTQTFFDLQHSGGVGQAVSAKGHLRMSVAVTGLMNQFLVFAEVENTGSRPVYNLILSVVNNAKLLQVTPAHVRLGVLLPGGHRVFRFHVDAPKAKQMYDPDNPAQMGGGTAVATPSAEVEDGAVTPLNAELNLRVVLASTASASNGEASLLSALVVMPPIQYEE